MKKAFIIAILANSITSHAMQEPKPENRESFLRKNARTLSLFLSSKTKTTNKRPAIHQNPLAVNPASSPSLSRSFEDLKIGWWF